MKIQTMLELLDEMVDDDGSRMEVLLFPDDAMQIRAVLRAGQELADAVRKWDDGFISGRAARKLVSEKRKAWDKLMKGE
jgi:hypothetical protein